MTAVFLLLGALSAQQSHFLAPDRALAAPAPLLNHGPSTTGGGASVLSGETLRAGRFATDWRTDWVQYESVSVAEAEAAAMDHGHFDALDSSLTSTLALAYGLTEDLQLAAQLGWYQGSNFLDAEEDGMGGAESSTGDPSGLTDLWVSAKWRLVRGARGHFALIGGVKLPTGTDDETLANGEVLEPSSQPGSGAVDWQAGAAYSRFLDPKTSLDASVVLTLRGEHDEFQVGHRADFGVAVARQISPGTAAEPGLALFGEILGIRLEEDEEAGVANDDSGGTAFFAVPGLRWRFASGVAATLAVSIPASQDWNGEQIDTDLKVTFVVSLDW